MTQPLTAFPITADLIRGAAELETTDRGILPHRLPAWARKQCPDPQLAMVEAQPSGVRIAFRTRATAIELDPLRSRTTYAGLPPRPDGVVELVVDGNVAAHSPTSGGNTVTIDMSNGGVEQVTGDICTVRFAGLPAAMKSVQLWLPHNEKLELTELRADATIEPDSVAGRPAWVHHGSSISHGSNATRPTGIWPTVAARTAGYELTNLGLGGSALLDQFTARILRDAEADVISVKLGINVVNTDLMRLRAFGPAVHGFLDTIRDGHPSTPLLVVSPIFCELHEHTPGPGSFDMDALTRGIVRFTAAGNPADVAAGKLTLTVIRSELERIVRERQASDAHLFYLDGRELYGADDAHELPLPDALHPDAETHQLMGERFARLVFGDGGVLQASGLRPQV